MKKVIAIVLSIILLVFTAGTASGESGPVKTYAPVASVAKDETVYVNLGGNGAVKQLSVVNRLETPTDGIYSDYGNYSGVTNLTNEAAASVEGDKISWRLDADAKGFYYQGQMANGEPPFLFKITYFLNGTETKAPDMAGKNGPVKMTVKVTPNPNAKDYFRKNYMCQLQAELDLNKCGNIAALKANGFIAGKTKTLSFTVLPEKEAEFEITFDARDFTFGGFTATALPFDAGKMIDIDTKDLKDGVNDMKDGVQELIDGTGDLKSGLKKLSNGVSDLSSGAKAAKSGLSKYKGGLKDYTDGISELYANAKKVAQALRQLKANAQDLKSGYAGLKGGVKSVFSALSPLAPPELAGQISYLSGKLDSYGDGLNAFCGGVSDLSAGMDALTDGIKQIDGNGDKLLSGLASIINGMGKLTDGLSKTASEMKKLPDEVQDMIDGQTELKDGVQEASDKFDEFSMGDPQAKPVSFASEKNTVRSVQFIYKSDEIKMEEEEAAKTDSQQTQKGFLEKFTDLFK